MGVYYQKMNSNIKLQAFSHVFHHPWGSNLAKNSNLAYFDRDAPADSLPWYLAIPMHTIPMGKKKGQALQPSGLRHPSLGFPWRRVRRPGVLDSFPGSIWRSWTFLSTSCLHSHRNSSDVKNGIGSPQQTQCSNPQMNRTFGNLWKNHHLCHPEQNMKYVFIVFGGYSNHYSVKSPRSPSIQTKLFE